jgi:hypothetical protein
MSFKAFLQADFLENLATIPEGELMEVAALFKSLELLGPFPDLVNTKNEDGTIYEFLIERDLDGLVGRVSGYGTDRLILFSYSPLYHVITLKALTSDLKSDLEIFAEADDLDDDEVLPLSQWLASLSPALQSQIESYYQSITSPVIARRKLLAARSAAFAEIKSLFNFSPANLASFEKRCDYLLTLLRGQLGNDLQSLSICATFKDGTVINSPSFSSLGSGPEADR